MSDYQLGIYENAREGERKNRNGTSEATQGAGQKVSVTEGRHQGEGNIYDEFCIYVSYFLSSVLQFCISWCHKTSDPYLKMMTTMSKLSRTGATYR